MEARRGLVLRRFGAAGSLILFNGLLFLYLWWGKMQYRHDVYLGVTYAVCLVLVLVGHRVFGDGRRSLGLRLDNWRAALRAYGTFTLGAGALLVVVGVLFGNFDSARLQEVGPYLFWAGLQQYVLQGFLRPRFEDVVRPTAAPPDSGRGVSAAGLISVVLAAGVFAALHWPHPTLVLLTFGGALGWCGLFLRTPSWPGVWLSHAVLGVLLVLLFKQGGIDQFRVGLDGYRFESYGDGVQVAAGYDSLGHPFVATLPGPDLGHPSRVRIFDVEGRQLSEWVAFPQFDFSGRLAVGDLGFGPGDEVAVVPGPAEDNPPLVRIFDCTGRMLGQFAAGALPPEYGASISIHCGEIDLASGPGPGAPARIAAYGPDGRLRRSWALDGRTGFVNGIQGTGFGRACEEGAEGNWLVWGTGVSVNPSDFLVVRAGMIMESRETLPTTCGLRLATLRLKHGVAGVAVAPGPLVGYPPWIRVYYRGRTWALMHEFVPFGDDGTAGANLAGLDIDGDGQDELVIGEGTAPGRPPIVRIYRLDGTPIAQWRAY